MVNLGQKDLPLIHSYGTLQSLTKSINKSEREHDLVIAVSFVYLELLSIINLIVALAYLVLNHICCLLLWIEVLCPWRDTIAEGSNYCSTPTLGSYAGCPGIPPTCG